MPSRKIPAYRLHKPTGQAIVGLGGRTIYLGKHKSKASRQKYEQEIAKYLENGRQVPPTRAKTDIRIEEAIIQFLEYAEEHYTKDGRTTRSFSNHRESLAYLNRWYGNKRVSEFGPVALQYLRTKILEEGQTKRGKNGQGHREDYKRHTVNSRIGCVVNFYRWLVTNEKCPVEIWTALKAVPSLSKGKSKCKESVPVRPVESEIVNATLPHLPSVVADMVRVQLLTGARPGEICCMRPCDIDRTHAVAWKYTPHEHKTDYLGNARHIPIGPRAQAVLQPHLTRLTNTPEQIIFSPIESVRQQNEQKRLQRKCKIYESQEQQRKVKQAANTPKCHPKDRYTTDSYRRAIERAAEKGGQPHWTPHQLRHNAGTDIREKYGLDGAQAVLGHSSAKITEIYAELNFEKAAKIAAEIG